MEAKLKQLDAEREELAKYQKIDRERRSLEYAIHDKEVSDTRAAIEQASPPPFLPLLSFLIENLTGTVRCVPMQS